MNGLTLRIVSFYCCFCAPFATTGLFAQKVEKSDSLISTILKESNTTGQEDQGLMLIKTEKYEEANTFFTGAINKDESNRDAYFKRGVTNWKLNDSLSACRDWSAVLALGDTATYLLLQKNCHGDMVFEDDTIPASRVRSLFVSPVKAGASGENSSLAKTVVEEMPSFPGGESALIDYFNRNLTYPATAKAKGIQGRVYVNFIISKKGKVLYPYVVRGIGKDCDQEALRLIRSMPPWKAGKDKGKAVTVRYNLPVRFSIR
ncbi:MAG TPA: energy transducer TonB [Bacteroidia bacterium]|nr:energy transducer TonB [Bacteroidia bacterium]